MVRKGVGTMPISKFKATCLAALERVRKAVPLDVVVQVVVGVEVEDGERRVVAPHRTWGLAGTLGLAVMVRASLGLYVEGTASIVAGGGTRDAVFTRHAMFSFDAGVRLDLERLP